MNVAKSNERLVFDQRTLRLIIGALAFAFPCGVIALTGKVTTSISASYHEAQSRDVFVGFLFVIGALLISYKGHVLSANRDERPAFLNWFKRYQEDWISTVGGIAAILTAVNPTARDGYPMDTKAVIHSTGAFILFATVVYFCLIAFLRSVNEKLVEENPVFLQMVLMVESAPAVQAHTLKERFYHWLCLWLPEVCIFLSIARAVSREYDWQAGGSDLPGKAEYMWLVYGKKITRGYVYLLCGAVIAVTLAGFVLISWRLPDLVRGSKATFIIETIALVFFGVAWMTASQLEYLVQFQRWWEARREKKPAIAQPGAA